MQQRSRSTRPLASLPFALFTLVALACLATAMPADAAPPSADQAQARDTPGNNPAWTPWLNRDVPSGTGDWETLSDFRKTGQVCQEPKQIQCRLRDSKERVKTGLVDGREQYLCEPDVGGICDNRKQRQGVRCSDYEVRFLCPPGQGGGR